MTTTWVALLRVVNVGGTGRVADGNVAATS